MKFVIFTLAEKSYGVDINQVIEVIRMRKITPVPDAAAFVEGVVSVRGKIITLINLRKKLGMEARPLGKSDRIIVSRTADHVIGLAVDSVSGVVNIDKADIALPDEALSGASYLIGVVRKENKIILLADIEKFLTKDAKEDLARIKSRVKMKPKETR